MPGRRRVPRRKRFFIGCEGESEQGYAALLQSFINQKGLALHIDAKVLTKAGDPLARAKRAIAEISQGERGSKPSYAGRFLIFDTDVIGQTPDRDARMVQIARDSGLILVRQERCFESVLLRHFSGHENDNPSTSAEALNRLTQIWPEYRKGASAQDLAKRLQLVDAQKSAANPLNSGFAVLMAALDLAP